MWTFAAVIIALCYTWLQVRVSRNPNTFFLIGRNGHFWLYCVIYGLIAGIGFLLADTLIAHGKFKIEMFGFTWAEIPFWARALAVGLSAKPLMQLSLIDVKVGSTPVPLGFKTIVLPLENFLLTEFDKDEFVKVNTFVGKFAAHYQNLAAVKTAILNNIPFNLPQQAQGAFRSELTKDKTVIVAMSRFLRFVGKQTFENTFPLSQPTNSMAMPQIPPTPVVTPPAEAPAAIPVPTAVNVSKTGA